MVFNNPYGLLALSSVPAIVFLHFFRRSKKALVIGGLHLWRHAPARKPAGERFTRLFKNLSLLFSILAAVLLSLLLAGMDFPRTESGRHLVFVLDDSISMNAKAESSAAERARKALLDQAEAGDLFTLIAAGAKPRLLAGPMAEKKEFVAALDAWRPLSLACDASAAADLSAKFLPPEGRAAFITDHPADYAEYSDAFSVIGVGRPLENAAIVFADRFRLPGGKDRVVAVVRNYGDRELDTRLNLAGEKASPGTRSLKIPPDQALSVSLDLAATDELLTLTLPEDALADDNQVRLAPLAPRMVKVAARNSEGAHEALARAVEAVPGAVLIGDEGSADLVFVFSGDFANALYEPEWNTAGGAKAAPSWDLSRFPAARVLCFLPAKGAGRDERLALAQGRDVWTARQEPVAASLDTSGLLWPYLPLSRKPEDAEVLAETKGRGLFFLRRTPGAPVRYYLDLAWDAGNLFRTNAWPLLVSELVGQARQFMPGVDGANFRAGQLIRINPLGVNGEGGAWILEKDGKEERELDAGAGAYLGDLAPGSYLLKAGDEKVISRFSVNAFAPAESELRAASSNEGSAAFSTVSRTRENRWLYILLLAAAIVFLACALVFHDLSR